jgi:hypothetical protein
MATKKKSANAAPKKNPSQSGLLSCTHLWRIYLSDELILKAKGGAVDLDDVRNGIEGAGQAEVKVTNSTDQIVLHEGFDPQGNKSIFMVRVPQDSQVFRPKKK